MSQISPPIRILLICAVALIGAWTLFLRPSAEPVAPAADTPVPAVKAGGPEAGSAAGKVVEKANEASAANDAKAEAAADGTTQAAATPGVAGANGPATAPTPGEPGRLTRAAADGLPLRVTRAMADGKVVVLLFWAPRSAEDKAVRKALNGIDRHKGRVLAHATHIKRIAGYQQITRGAQVEQSPTVVVVDRRRKVQTLVGYVDRTSIDQAVSDALRTKRR